MANILDPMDLKQIITLHLGGYSNRQIAVTLGISRNTINAYISRVRAGNYCVEELVQQTPAQLSEMFPHTSTVDSNLQDKLLQYFDQINLARNHPGFTFQYHYQQYVSLVDTLQLHSIP